MKVTVPPSTRLLLRHSLRTSIIRSLLCDWNARLEGLHMLGLAIFQNSYACHDEHMFLLSPRLGFFKVPLLLHRVLRGKTPSKKRSAEGVNWHPSRESLLLRGLRPLAMAFKRYRHKSSMAVSCQAILKAKEWIHYWKCCQSCFGNLRCELEPKARHKST